MEVITLVLPPGSYSLSLFGGLGVSVGLACCFSGNAGNVSVLLNIQLSKFKKISL
jgi:hypothetical protein